MRRRKREEVDAIVPLKVLNFNNISELGKRHKVQITFLSQRIKLFQEITIWEKKRCRYLTAPCCMGMKKEKGMVYLWPSGDRVR